MSRRVRRCSLVLFLGALMVGSISTAAQASDRPARHASVRLPYSATRVLVGYLPGTRGARAQVEAYAGATRLETAGAGVHVLRVPHGQVLSTIATLTRFSQVAYAEPDYVLHADATPNDPSFSQLWGMQTIQAPTAWDKGTGTAPPVVGVVDTGIDWNHEDLATNMWSNPGAVGNALCDPGTHGYNAIVGSCFPTDDNQHGTHVSGTIGAVGNNGTGVAGVNWTTDLMGLKFLNAQGSGYTSDAVTAIDFAVKARQAYNADPTKGANVVALNNSWGGGSYSVSLLNEINAAGTAGIVFVVAAGNSSWNLNLLSSYPCSYNTSNMICVAATTQTDGLASFSNYGTNSVDLGAPGTNIYSTIPGGYGTLSGTSMATPHVTGAVALIAADCSSVNTVSGRMNAILSNTDPLSSLSGKVSTGGRLNLSKAVNSCAGGGSPPPTPPSPPTGLAASALSSSQINLAWNDVSTETGYKVQRSANGSTGWSQIGTTGQNVVTYSNTGLSPSTTYYYRVIATNGAGDSSPSSTASATTQAAPAPDFSLSVSPSDSSIKKGQATTYTVTVNRTGGFSGTVTLSVSGLPAGASSSWTPDNTSSPATLTITTLSNTARGTYTLTITGSSGALTRITSATLTIRNGFG